MPIWFDAHLDLASLAIQGRELRGPLERAAPPHPPAGVTLGSMRDAGVHLALATIFTEKDGLRKVGYPAGDAERAFIVGRAQLEVYRTLADESEVSLDLSNILRQEPGIGVVTGGMGVSETRPLSAAEQLARARTPKPHLGILMECADPIRDPSELEWWVERGVVAIGLAWRLGSRYAGGNSAKGPLTDLGRELVREMDRLGVVHDASHLSDESLAQLLESTDAPVIASHSNCRALLEPNGDERNLTDDAIRAITQRGGIIGINLVSAFLDSCTWDGGRAVVDDVVRHIEHLCEIIGDRRHVGLGSDIDGGFSADNLPRGIDSHADLGLICERLHDRGWSDPEIAGFACENWSRFWSGA